MDQGYQVRLYQAQDQRVWDEFVSNSKTPHFMFYRAFMEYHRHRFHDYSLLVFDAAGSLVAMLPANRTDDQVFSHQGLTFAGLLYKASTKQQEVTAALQALCAFLRAQGVALLRLKVIPSIFSPVPSDELLFALFQLDAQLYRRDLSSAIAYRASLPYSKGRKWQLKKAAQLPLQMEQAKDLSGFWPLLTEVLQQHHGVLPVHNQDEIQLLAARFPQQILCYQARLDGKVCAGAVLFLTPSVVHTQYLFVTGQGRRLGALDWLLDQLIEQHRPDYDYFNFGISNEQHGVVNQGLLSQKEAFGARAVVFDHYEIKLDD